MAAQSHRRKRSDGDPILESDLKYEQTGPPTLIPRNDEGFGDGIVVVGVGGAVDRGVRPRREAIDERSVAAVAHDKPHTVDGQAGDVLNVANVGQLAQHDDVHSGAECQGYSRRYRVPLPDPTLATRPPLTRSANTRLVVDWETPRSA